MLHRPTELARVHAHYGCIDGLVNNAGRAYASSVEEINATLFDEIFHLNVLAPIIAMQAVIPLMRIKVAGALSISIRAPRS